MSLNLNFVASGEYSLPNGEAVTIPKLQLVEDGEVLDELPYMADEGEREELQQEFEEIKEECGEGVLKEEALREFAVMKLFADLPFVMKYAAEASEKWSKQPC